MNTPADSADLVAERARQMQGARAGAPGLPREAMQGYPVPVLRSGEVWLAFPYVLRSGKPPAPPTITAPGWIGYIDAKTGAQAQFQTLDPTPAPAGAHKLPPTMDMAAFRAAERKMYALMSSLLDVAAEPGQALDAGQLAAAKEFRALWKTLAHKPIAGHYRSLNPAWFAALGIR